MKQIRPGDKVDRRRFLKTAAGTTAGAALTAWSLRHPAPGGAAVRSDRARAAEASPKRGGVLKWAGPAEVAHFDVHQGAFRFVLGQMYNNLVRFNPADGLKTIIPDLAESWKASPDGKTYTFKLRDGVKFHDGSAFSSADVVATFSRIIFPPPGMASIYKDQFAAVAKVEAIDRLNVRFVLKEPQPYFLELFTPSSMIVYSKKALDENNQDLRKVIAPGTGAFMFKERKVAEKWVMVRNPSYWDPEIPYLDGIELLHIPAWTDRGTAVLTGQADYSPNVSLETHQEGLKRKDIVGTVRYPGEFNSYQVHINNERKPFNDPRVRRAINLAVSRQNLIKAFGTQEPIMLTRWMTHASEFASPLAELEKLPGYRADKSADLAEAKKLMAAAGYANGFETISTIIQGNEYGTSYPTQVEIIEGMVGEIGIKHKKNVVDYTKVFQFQYRDVFGAFEGLSYKLGPQASAPEPTGQLVYDYHSKASTGWYGFDASGKGDNAAGDPAVDALLDKATAEFDPAKRKEIVYEIQKYLAKPQYGIRWPGGATGFLLAWPALQNFNVWQNDPRRESVREWIDDTKAPIKKA